MLCITRPLLSSIHSEVLLRWPHLVWCDCVSQCQHTLDRSCCVRDILAIQFAGFTTPLLIGATVPACSNISKMNISVVSISKVKTRQLTKKTFTSFPVLWFHPTTSVMLLKEVFSNLQIFQKDWIKVWIMTFLYSRKTVELALHDQRTRAVVFPLIESSKTLTSARKPSRWHTLHHLACGAGVMKRSLILFSCINYQVLVVVI